MTPEEAADAVRAFAAKVVYPSALAVTRYSLDRPGPLGPRYEVKHTAGRMSIDGKLDAPGHRQYPRVLETRDAPTYRDDGPLLSEWK